MKFMGFLYTRLDKYAILMKPGRIHILNADGVNNENLYKFLISRPQDYNFYTSWSALHDKVYVMNMRVNRYLTE